MARGNVFTSRSLSTHQLVLIDEGSILDTKGLQREDKVRGRVSCIPEMP